MTATKRVCVCGEPWETKFQAIVATKARTAMEVSGLITGSGGRARSAAEGSRTNTSARCDKEGLDEVGVMMKRAMMSRY